MYLQHYGDYCDWRGSLYVLYLVRLVLRSRYQYRLVCLRLCGVCLRRWRQLHLWFDLQLELGGTHNERFIYGSALGCGSGRLERDNPAASVIGPRQSGGNRIEWESGKLGVGHDARHGELCACWAIVHREWKTIRNCGMVQPPRECE